VRSKNKKTELEVIIHQSVLKRKNFVFFFFLNFLILQSSSICNPCPTTRTEKEKMSTVLKNKKKKEEEELRKQQTQTLSHAHDEESDSLSSDDDEPAEKKRKTNANAVKGTKNGGNAGRRRKGDGDDDKEAGEMQNENAVTNKNAELKINEKGTIEEDDLNGDNEENILTARGTPRLKKFIKRRIRRYLSLDAKIAVFERIVRDTDIKTKKLRYGASNEICADFSIGRKTINNIKNLFERLIREGKDLSPILTKETMEEIPIKLNIDPDSINRQPLTAEQLSHVIGGGMGGNDDEDSDDSEDPTEKTAKKALVSLKQKQQQSSSNNAAVADDDSSNPDISRKVINAAALAATNAAGGEKMGGDQEDEDGVRHTSKYKTLYDDETRLRKMFKVNNVGRQTKLNDLTIERIKQIVPYCFGVKELSDMYEREFGEKIHQSTLWRYCSELNITIPKKTAKK
jgi:hypothetical protein